MRGVSFLLLLALVALNRGQILTYASGSSTAYSLSIGNRYVYPTTTLNYRLLVNSGYIIVSGGIYRSSSCSTGVAPTLTISVVPTISNFASGFRYVQVQVTGFTSNGVFSCVPTGTASNSWASAQHCFTRTMYTSSSLQSFTIRVTNVNVSPTYTSGHVYYSSRSPYYYDVGVLATFTCGTSTLQSTVTPSSGSIYYGTRTISVGTFYTYSLRTSRHYCDYTGCTISYYLYDRCTTSSSYALTLQVGVIPSGFTTSRSISIYANNRFLKSCNSVQLGTTSYTSWSYMRNCASMRLVGYTRSYSYGYINIRVLSGYTSRTITSIYELGFQINLQCRSTSSISGYTYSSGSVATTTSGTSRPTYYTPYPTSRPTTTSGGAIAGIVIGNIFFYICCFCVIRYVCCLNNTTTAKTVVYAPTPAVTTSAVVMTSTTTTVQQTQQTQQPQIIGTPLGQPLNQPAIQQPPIQQPPMQQPIQQPVQQTAPAETPGYQYNYYSQPQYDYNAPGPTPQQPGYTPGAPGAPGAPEYVQQPQYAYASLQGPPPTQGAPVYGQVAQSGNPGGPVGAYNPAGAPPAMAPGYMGPGGMADASADAPPPAGVAMGAPPTYNYAPPPSTGGGMAEAPPGYSEAVSAPPPQYNDMGPPPAYGGGAPPPAYGGAPPAYGAPGGYGVPPAYGGEGQPGQGGGEGAATTGAAPRYG